jgi:hypothetical protein
MTAPEHYSRDIVLRCQSLIRHLLPKVEERLSDEAQFGGPLRTTFLLAMATPMIVLPTERIFKPGTDNAAQAGDDRDLDPELAEEVGDVLGEGRTFGQAPFAKTSTWSYVHGYKPFNIALDWPDNLLSSLAHPQAVAAARKALARRILLDLRNALAHGGIAYLDEDGRNSEEGRNSRAQTAMFAFVGTKKKNGRVVGLNVLRVHQKDFSAFLGAWTDWLSQTSVLNALSGQPSMAA